MAKRKQIQYRINENGCYICTSHCYHDGYPHFYRKGYGCVKIIRFLWQEKHGMLSKDIFILHNCDNPACINLSHVRAGTAKDNTQDSIKRGRYPLGEKKGNSNLNEDKVRLIRNSPLSERKLGKVFGTDRSTIGYIKRGRTWKHVI